ncbi:MAG: hypothetical protein K0S63_884 [Gammaproteobacteria bacterium]|nr:hypothetical protein [Gammaproteobacteria bacterium]
MLCCQCPGAREFCPPSITGTIYCHDAIAGAFVGIEHRVLFCGSLHIEKGSFPCY